jgi:predicted solute-binding protein
MKLWRKLSKKQPDGSRTGRQIAHQMRMFEALSKQSKKSYPLMDALFERAGFTYVLTRKQQETLKTMIESTEGN